MPLQIWNEMLKVKDLKEAARLLRWCAHDSDFIPNRVEGGFEGWKQKGLTFYYTLYTKGTIECFEKLKLKYGLEKHDFYRYLQIRHYLNKKIPKVHVKIIFLC